MTDEHRERTRQSRFETHDEFEVRERHKVIGVEDHRIFTLRQDTDDETVYQWRRPLDSHPDIVDVDEECHECGDTIEDHETRIRVDTPGWAVEGAAYHEKCWEDRESPVREVLDRVR